MTLKMNLPLKVKLKVILLTLLNTHLNSNIRSELIQIFKHYCRKTVNQNATKCALLADETATTSGDEHVASPPKVSKVKEISEKGQQNWLLKSVIPQKASALCHEEAMASNSDLDGEDYYIVEDDNESASFEYVPCVNYPNDKVYPEDEKNGWVRLEEYTGPPNIDLRDTVKTTWI